MHHLINNAFLHHQQVRVLDQGAGIANANPFENVELDPQDDALVWGDGSFQGLDRAAVS